MIESNVRRFQPLEYIASRMQQDDSYVIGAETRTFVEADVKSVPLATMVINALRGQPIDFDEFKALNDIVSFGDTPEKRKNTYKAAQQRVDLWMVTHSEEIVYDVAEYTEKKRRTGLLARIDPEPLTQPSTLAEKRDENMIKLLVKVWRKSQQLTADTDIMRELAACFPDKTDLIRSELGMDKPAEV